jgi:hypothetical protein
MKRNKREEAVLTATMDRMQSSTCRLVWMSPASNRPVCRTGSLSLKDEPGQMGWRKGTTGEDDGVGEKKMAKASLTGVREGKESISLAAAWDRGWLLAAGCGVQDEARSVRLEGRERWQQQRAVRCQGGSEEARSEAQQQALETERERVGGRGSAPVHRTLLLEAAGPE